VLTEAARAEGADARTRQNLALAYALSGRWVQARMLASQDLSPAKLEARMAEWSKLAEQPDAQIRVASLIGTKAQQDAGMPVRLALSNFAIRRWLRRTGHRTGQRRSGACRDLCSAAAGRRGRCG
jgi:D-alanyl-D-alanine carboxypeptidase